MSNILKGSKSSDVKSQNCFPALLTDAESTSIDFMSKTSAYTRREKTKLVPYIDVEKR